MPALDEPSYRALIATGCPQCKRNYLKLRALATATISVMEGEPVSSLKWQLENEALRERVYRIDCAECKAILFERDECPLCQARGGLSRVLSAQHGLAPPKACPRCGLSELKLTVELRMHADTLLGAHSRRKADAEPHDPGFHVIQAECRDCEDVVAAVGDGRCAACGRSSLLKRLR
ncbi:MAG TPA: hypothetical protein VMZ28_19320 [Kofleriaceae bacterium]|nr:hypothetical protein [Kofleriaceae bacterium]